MDQNSLYSNIPDDNQNEVHETFFSETVDNEFNGYLGCLQQPADVIPADVIPSDNGNSSCGCIHCSTTISDNNLQMTYEDTNDHSVSPQISLAPCPPTHINHNVNEQVSSIVPQNSSMPQDPMYMNEQTSQSSSTQQYTCNNSNEHRQQSISTFSSTRDDLRVNSSSNTEFFKIVIPGGFEISVSHPYLSQIPNERNRQSQRNEQSHLTLKNHTRRTESRDRPYRTPTEQNCRHNKISNRNHHVVNSSPRQRHYSSCSHSCCSGKQNHFSNVNGTSAEGSSLNTVNMQDARVNQSDNPQTQPQFH